MRILKREKIKPITLFPGDTVVLSYREPGLFGDDVTEVLTHTVDEEVTYTEAAIFDPSDELGWKSGIGGAFGTP